MFENSMLVRYKLCKVTIRVLVRSMCSTNGACSKIETSVDPSRVVAMRDNTTKCGATTLIDLGTEWAKWKNLRLSLFTIKAPLWFCSKSVCKLEWRRDSAIEDQRASNLKLW
jgi:hypothetical protein